MQRLQISKKYIAALILIVIGLFLMFGISGHAYLGMALIFFGILILFYLLCSIFIIKIPKRIRIVRSVVTAVVMIGFSYFCFVEFFIIKDAVTDIDVSPDYVIVLGAHVHGTQPSPTLIDRLECTYEYMIDHPHCIAILSGGNETGQLITEAECMFQYLIDAGIPENRLILEVQATSTEENLTYSKQIIEEICTLPNPVIGVLTSDYHLHRAKYLASLQSIDVVGISAQTQDFSIGLNNFIREAFGMTYYYVFGVE